MSNVSVTFNLEETLFSLLYKYQTENNGHRTFNSDRTNELDLRNQIAHVVHVGATAAIAKMPTDEDKIRAIAKSYGLSPVSMMRRAILDMHASIMTVFAADDGFTTLMSTTSTSSIELESAFDAAQRGETTASQNNLTCPKCIPMSQLKSIEFNVIFDERPTGTLENSAKGAVTIPYDVIDFNYRSKGRFSAYQYVIFATALQKSGITIKPSTEMFYSSEAMITQRYAHAQRVYNTIRIERESTTSTNHRTINIEWFEAIFTSDNLSAMNDVLMDIENDLWYMNFYRSEHDCAQYSQICKDRSDIFALLTALQGHPLEEVRSRALVLLNAFLDDHEWQLFFPLVPRVKRLGDDIVITFTIESQSEGEAAPQGVHLQLCAPPSDISIASKNNFLTYHKVDEWKFVGHNRAVNLWEGTVRLGQFNRCGFFDWRVLTSDETLGSWEVALLPMEKDINFSDIPWLNKMRTDSGHCSSVFKLPGRHNSAPVQGRFICQKSDNDFPLLEYQIGSIAADDRFSDNTSAGDLVAAIKSSEENSEESKFGTICLRGANNLSNRGPPSAFSGSLARSLTDLTRIASTRGIDVCVEATFRVSTQNYHRRYKDLMVFAKDTTLSEAYGAEGLAKSLKDSSLLNYRDVRSWKLFLSEISEWISQNMATGVTIEGLGSGLPVYAVDLQEMWKTDSDEMPHYTDKEKLLGKVIMPLVVENKCQGASSWPDPFSIYVTKGIWSSFPYAKIIGETVQSTSVDQLSRSGVIPYVRSLLPLVSSALNYTEHKIADVSIIKAESRLWNRSNEKNAMAKLNSLLLSIVNTAVPGSNTIISSLSPGALTSFSHLEGKAWPYVSLLTLLPLNQSFGWNEKFHKAIDDATTLGQYLMPYVVKDRTALPDGQTCTDGSPLIHNDAQRARSFLGSVRAGAHNPHSPLANRSTSMLLQNRNTPLELNKSSSFVNIGSANHASMVGKVQRVVEETTKHAAPEIDLSPDKLQSLAAIGLDASKFYLHIEACVKRGKELNEVLKSGLDGKTPELYIPLTTTIDIPHVITFARVTSNGSFAICAVNFGNDPQVASVPLNSLHQLLLSFKINRHANYIVQAFTENGIQAEDVCTLLESVTMNVEFTLQPGETGLRIFSIQPQTMKLPKKELYRFAFHRLVQGAKDAHKAVRRGDKEACSAVARSLNSNALVVDFINSLQERNGMNEFAKYMQDTATVIKDLYNCSEEQGYNKFLSTLLDLGVFSTHSSIPIDDALKTGTPTSLAKVYSEKVAAIAQVQDPVGANMPSVSLAKVLSNSNGLGPIVLCTSEYGKFSTVGGLGVMVDELASTLVKDFNQEVWVISPYYHRNTKGRENNFSGDGVEYIQNVGVQVGPEYMEFGLHQSLHKNVRSFFIHHADIYSHPYPDNKGEAQVKFLTFTAKAMLETICFLMGRGERMPELVISNDWPTGLLPAHAKHSFGDTFRGTTFYHIVHNLDPSYEGRVWCNKDLHYLHQLNTELLVDPTWKQMVYNPSRCALLSADSWGTVSPSYRNELLGIGCQSSSPLQPILARCADSFATPNGVPIEEREQIILKKMKSCKLIDENFEIKQATEWLDIHTKAKAYLQKTYFGFEEPDPSIPICAFVGRVTSQKGVHLIVQGAEHLIKRYNYRIQFLVGGMVNWNDPYSAGCGRAMLDLRNRYPYCFWCGPDDFFYDGAIVNAGADIALMPSAFEPGGIVQHEFFSGGTPVLAFKTGGLRDTVHEFIPEKNIGSGWTFEAFNQGDYLYACERAVRIFNDKPKYDRLRLNAKMATVSSTEVSGKWLAEFTRIRRKFNVPVPAEVPKFDAAKFQQWYEKQATEDIIIGETNSPVSVTPSSPVSSRVVLPCAKIRYTPPEWAPKPRTVAVSGGWNNWMVRHPMYFDNATGQFFVSIQGKRGSWPYKIIRDGEWILNPDEEETIIDHEGNTNSVLHI